VLEHLLTDARLGRLTFAGGMEAMRYTTRTLLVAIVIVASSAVEGTGAETSSRWWPFGKKGEANVAEPPKAATSSTTPPLTSPNMAAAHPSATAAAPSGATSATAATEPATKERWMFSSPKGKVSWPHLNKPKTGMFAEKPANDATRNSWVDQPVTPKPSAFKPITDGAHKFSDNTKKAWKKTVAAVKGGEATPAAAGSNPGARVAKREVEPTFWKKMFGAKSELQGPQTVPEWMAQQRLDP
jgi:hypothetical protein